MSSRKKLLLLLFSAIGVIFLLLILFMSTDYAKDERAYFQAYPYLEMAAREKKALPDIITARPAIKEIPEVIIPTTSLVQLIISPPQKKKEKAVITQLASPKTSKKPPRKIIKIKNQSEKKLVIHPPPVVPSKQPQIKTGWIYESELAYEAYGNGEYKTAIIHFERALIFLPHNRDIILQLAYAYKKTGQNSAALKKFNTAIDQYGDSNAPFALRREVEQLENRFEANGYMIYRDESSSPRQLGADLTQSQAGVEVSYQPKKAGFNNGRKFQVYARLLSGMIQDRLALNPDSYQAGVGLRIKPLSDHNLVLSAERLIKVGDFARNDWMLRAGYSRDYLTDYQEDKTGWWSYSLYLDAALIDPASPDIFLTSQVTGGYSMIMAEGLVMQPRLSALASWQKDSFREASLIEAGPGLKMRYYFNDTKYEAYRSYIDLSIEYRIKLSGNSIGGSGPIVSLLVHF